MGSNEMDSEEIKDKKSDSANQIENKVDLAISEKQVRNEVDSSEKINRTFNPIELMENSEFSFIWENDWSPEKNEMIDTRTTEEEVVIVPSQTDKTKNSKIKPRKKFNFKKLNNMIKANKKSK